MTGPGTRRRPSGRSALIGLAAGVVAVVLGGVVLAGLSGREPVEPPLAAAAAGSDLDGYLIGYLPAGLVRQGTDSVGTVLAGPDGIHQEDIPPTTDQIPVQVTSRSFQTADRRRGLDVAVWRPLPTGAGTGRLAAGYVASFLGVGPVAQEWDGTRIGRAVWVEHRGTEVTNWSVVITTPDDSVVSVSTRRAMTRDELDRVVRGLAGIP